MTLKIGDPLPKLKLPAQGDKEIALSDFQGKKLVVYFYPKDNTPGCTLEGQDFTRLYPEFTASGADIVGISKDDVASHEKFAAKFDFPFMLLADTEELACQAFDVIKEKNMYGRKYLGIERSTFVFDADGVLQKEWRKVKVKGHAQAVLEAVQAL